MADPILGVNAKLYRNTATWASPSWDEITNVRDLTLNCEKGEADVTVRGGNGWRQTVGTLKDGSLEFSMVWDNSDADFTAIKNAFFNDTSIELLALDGSATPASGVTVQGLHADFAVTNFTRNEGLEEALTVDVTLKPTYSSNAPEWYSDTGT